RRRHWGRSSRFRGVPCTPLKRSNPKAWPRSVQIRIRGKGAMAEREGSYWATGRRKTSVARVRLIAGEGKFHINRRSLDDYFGRETSRMVVNQPFEVTNTRSRFDVVANIHGGGIAAQAQALRHGISR